MAPTTSLSNLVERVPKMAIALKPVIFDDNVRHVLPRGSDADDSSVHAINITLAFLGMLFFTLICSSLLFFLRRRRLQQRRRAELLPYHNKDSSLSVDSIEDEKNGHTSVVFIGRNGKPMLQNPGAPPQSPENVPEIHITFPDETDDNGRLHSGRVLIVRVGDNATIGLEPMQEQLPAYEQQSKTQFQSIDMDRIGGLKEKSQTVYN